MAGFLENLKFDFAELLELISDFFSMLHSEVMNDEMTGLVMYFYSCIPGEIRSFMIVVVVLTVILGLRELLRTK